MNDTISTTITAIGTGFMATLLGSWDMALEILLIVIALDYITGIMSAFKQTDQTVLQQAQDIHLCGGSDKQGGAGTVSAIPERFTQPVNRAAASTIATIPYGNNETFFDSDEKHAHGASNALFPQPHCEARKQNPPCR